MSCSYCCWQQLLIQESFGHSVGQTAALVVASISPVTIHITIRLQYHPCKSLNSYQELISILYPPCSFIQLQFQKFCGSLCLTYETSVSRVRHLNVKKSKHLWMIRIKSSSYRSPPSALQFTTRRILWLISQNDETYIKHNWMHKRHQTSQVYHTTSQ
jgi:hypothetical protein